MVQTLARFSSQIEDDIFEERHNSSTDYTRNGDGDKPGHENVAKKSPVNSLFGSEPANGHNRAHLGEKQARELVIKFQWFSGKEVHDVGKELQTAELDQAHEVKEINCGRIKAI